MNIRLLIIVSFFCALFSDAIYYMSVSMRISMDATYFILTLKLISLSCLLAMSARLKWKLKFPAWPNLLFSLMIIWNVITIVRGGLLSKDYWDWKYLLLNTAYTFLIPYAVITGALYTYTASLFNAMVTRLFIIGFLVIPLTLKMDLERELFPRGLMITVCFFILFIPYLKPKWRIVVACVAFVSVFIALGFRSNLIRIFAATGIMTMYYFRRFITSSMLKLTCLALLTAPLIFLFLGLSGQYNIFKPTEDIDKYTFDYNNGTDEGNLAEDTRTFLYQEVLSSMQQNHSFWLGEGATAKYKTAYFDDEPGQTSGRYGSEVGVLNTLLYSGIIGVVLYALVLFSAIYYGINYSSNFLCKMLAVFLAFRWVVFFIEDFIQYDMNYYFLWMAIGLCLSKDFRALTDADLKTYFDFPANRRLIPKLY